MVKNSGNVDNPLVSSGLTHTGGIVVEAGVINGAHWPYHDLRRGWLCDAHFTNTEFYLTLSKDVHPDMWGAFAGKMKDASKHYAYDSIRRVTFKGQGDGYFWIRIQVGNFFTGRVIQLSVSEQRKDQLDGFLTGVSQLGGKLKRL